MSENGSTDADARVLVVRRSRALRLLLIVAGFTVAGCFMIESSDVEIVVVGVAVIAFFGVLGIPLMIAQLIRPARLELDGAGFTLNQPLRKPLRRSWAEVSHFSATSVPTAGPYGVGRTRPILVSYSTSRSDRAKLRRFNSFQAGGDESLPAGFDGLNAPQLADLLNHHRDTARADGRHYFS